MKHAWPCALLVLAACERSTTVPCLTSADCEARQACLVDIDADEGVCLGAPGRDQPPPPLRRFATPSRTDVLLVVDDGPGTAELQARLVASLGALLDRPNDLRVAVTTTTANGSICEAPHAASNGALVATSCLDRLDRFIGIDGTDARWLCTAACSYTTAALGLDPAQPWIDLRTLPEGIEPVDALACLVPQGIAGCEHAAPVRAAANALAFEGLWRPFDAPQVVIVTDGVDCSVTEEGAAAFDPSGSRALWSDPAADEPTAAVCWNAGVACQGDPAGFEDCWPVDVDPEGAPVDEDGTPVLVAMWRAAASLQSDLTELHVIGGAPVGEPREPTYSAVGDPAWRLEHGIDPGCTDGIITALPPVRLRDLATSLTSVCNPDYRQPLRDAVTFDPVCLRPCEVAALTVTHERPNEGPVPLPSCEGQYPALTVPTGAPACHWVQDAAEPCALAPDGRTTELVLRVVDPVETGAFLLEPNPWSPAVQIAGCPD